MGNCVFAIFTKALPTDGRTDGPKDRRTNTASFRDARMDLKTRPIGQQCASAFCILCVWLCVVEKNQFFSKLNNLCMCFKFADHIRLQRCHRKEKPLHQCMKCKMIFSQA